MLKMNDESVYVKNFVLSGTSTENFIVADERVQKVVEKVDASHLNENRKSVLSEIVKEFQDVFYVKGDLLTVTNMIEHEVP